MTKTTNKAPIAFGLLKTAFCSEHYPKLFAGESTHDPAMRLCSQLGGHTDDPEHLREIAISALPEGYPFNPNQNLLEELDGLVQGGITLAETRPENNEKGQGKTVDKLIVLLEKAGAKIFRGSMQQSYISQKLGSGAYLHHNLRSHSAKLLLRQIYYQHQKTVLTDQKLKESLDTLDAKAQFEMDEEPTYLRIAGNQSEIFIDLGRDDGKVVHITPEGWEVRVENAVKFYRTSGVDALPEPVKGGSLQKLRDLLHLDDRNWVLLLAFLLNCLKPNGPYMCLLVEGEQGSGKSVTCHLIKYMIDPNKASKMRLPEAERDLMIQAKEYFLLNFDNASFIKDIISDMLCSLSTGGGFSTRKLYTDDELQVFSFTRPYIINGISNIGHRPDLLERAIHLKLPTMPEGERRTERELLQQFDMILPEVLGCLYDCVACALKNFDDVPVPSTIRMADCAHWLAAAEAATGLKQGKFLSTLEESQDELMIERVIDQPVAARLLHFLKGGPVQSYIGLLYEELQTYQGERFDRSFPSTPMHFSSALKRLAPALKKLGIHFEFGEKDRFGRPIHIWMEGYEDKPVRDLSPLNI